MLKLLTCLLFVVAVGVAMLQTRQQRLELNYQINTLHNQIQSNQAKLWSQQLQIAVHAGTPSISKTIEQSALNMVPATPAQPSFIADPARPTFTASR